MCTQPLKAFKYGKTKNGKDNYYVRSYACHHLEIDPNGRILAIYDDETTNLNNKPIHEFIEIPCGKCIECKLEYSKQWANRCMLEAKEHEDNCFITLTYNDDHVPLSDSYKYDTGEPVKNKTLRKRDIQLFLKRLRKHLDPVKIRYYLCGEYGEETKRPHYHLIIFGWKPNDLVFVGKNNLGYEYYYSPELEKIWTYGFNVIEDLNWNTAAYVARYTTKKLNNDFDEVYDIMNIEKEFVLMSRRPGIGANWYKYNKQKYQDYMINYIGTDRGSIAIPGNKYFDKLFEKDDPEKLENVKSIRKEFAKNKKKIIDKTTSLKYLERLKVDELTLKNKTKILKRKEI